MSLAAGLIASAAVAHEADDPLLRPIASESAQRWLTPQAPARIFGDTYSVGFGGLSVALIRTDAGLILVDGALPQSVRALEANLRSLGFDIRDVKLILSTEPHFDHAGGLAALARDSGATIVASAAAARVLRQGHSDGDDPQVTWLDPFPAVAKVRAVRDGERIRLGRTIVTARATAGHTAGSMSWTWKSCEGKACRTIVFASSFNPVAPESYRFTDHPAVIASFHRSFANMRGLGCDILISAHPGPEAGRALGKAPAEPSACRAYADRHARLLEARLAEEAKGTR